MDFGHLRQLTRTNQDQTVYDSREKGEPKQERVGERKKLAVALRIYED